jgi:hypothetical protein
MSELSGFASATISSSFDVSRLLLRDERLALGFVQAEAGENAAHFTDLIVDGIESVRADRTARRSGGSFRQAMQALDLLDQIGLALHVHAPARDGEGAGIVGLRAGLEAELAEQGDLLRVGNLDAKQGLGLGISQDDGLRLLGLGLNVHHAFGQLAARSFEDQLRRALAGPIADIHVRAALEAVARFTAQAELLAGAPDVRRMEIGALDQHIHGLVVDLRVRAAHHAGEGDAFLLISNEEHLIRQRTLLIVERLEFLAGGCAADNDGWLAVRAFGDEMIIERVQRLADFQHDVVRHVHDVADAADADFLQRALEPIRAWADFYAFDDAGGVARAILCVFDAN